MDLYFPAGGATARPVVVWVHGGGWTQGDKTNLPAGRSQVVAAGFVLAAVNYRLAPQYKWPAQIEDVKCAVRYLRAEAGRYGIDPQRIGAWGGSAGGHLVNLLGLAGPEAGFEGHGSYADQSSAVQAVVDMYGPSDLTNYGFSARGREVIQTVFGSSPGQAGDALRRASPVTYVSGNAPPFLILHGTADTLVAPTQSQELYNRLQAAGADATLVWVQHAGHGFVPVGGRPAPGILEIGRRNTGFFQRTLR
jgi:acetyl esterase/lipase